MLIHPYSVPLHSVSMIDQPRVFAEDMRYSRWEERPLLVKGKPWFDPKTGQQKFIEVKTHPIVYECTHGNVVVNDGKINILQSQFIASSGVKIIAGSVGSSNATPTDITLHHLVSELISGSARVTLTNTAGTAPANGDISLITGQTYTELITLQYIYLTSDANNGSVFAEYGLHSSTTLPASPTSTSGILYARFVPSSSFTKNSSFQVTMQWGQAA